MDLSNQIESLLRALAGGSEASTADAKALAMQIPPVFSRRERVKRRNVSRGTVMQVFLRDGFVDQYTGERLVFPGTLLLLGKLLPEPFATPEEGKGWRVGECHWIYWRLWPTIEHLDPVARGGHNDDLDRLVTTSQMVNSARGPWAADEVPEKIRIERIDAVLARARRWDGTLRWFLKHADRWQSYLDQDATLRGWHQAAKAAVKTEAWNALSAATRQDTSRRPQVD